MPTNENAAHPANISQARDVAQSFGLDAERYDRARPRYPAALIDRIAAEHRDLLDVGIGTGIAARQFREAGCHVLGVEPDPRMAAVARGHGFEVEESRFEEWDPRGRTFGAVVAGQTWHWVDPVAGAERAFRVLRPGGRLALFWNTVTPTAEMAEVFSAVYRRAAPSLPFNPWGTADPYGTIVEKVSGPLTSPPFVTAPDPKEEPTAPGSGGEPTAPVPGEKPTAPGPEEEPTAPVPRREPTAPGPWGEPTAPGTEDKPAAPRGPDAADGLATPRGLEVWRFAWEHEYRREDWLDQVPTAGGHQLLPPGELAALLDGLGEVIGERFVMPYETVVVTTTKPG